MDRLKHRLVAAECRIEELEEELELAVAHGKESTERMKGRFTNARLYPWIE